MNKRSNTPNKKVKNAKVIEYEGKTFKSKLEVYCYKKLKDANLSFQYEGQTYTLLEPFELQVDSYELRKTKEGKVFKKVTNKIRKMTYTPDFVGYFPNSKKKFIIEAKGMPNDSFPIRWKLFKKYIYDHNIDAVLFMPRNQKSTNEMVDIIRNYEEK